MPRSGSPVPRQSLAVKIPLDAAPQKSHPPRSLGDPVHKEILLMRRYVIAALFVSLALAACEGARNNTSWSTKKAGTEIVPPLKAKTTPPADTAKPDSASTDSTKAKH